MGRASMTVPTAPTADFSPKEHMEKVAAFAIAHPEFAPAIYARAAGRFRAEAAKPARRKDALVLHTLARELDALAREGVYHPQQPQQEYAETVDVQDEEVADRGEPADGDESFGALVEDMEEAKIGSGGDELVAAANLAFLREKRERSDPSFTHRVQINPVEKPLQTLYGSQALIQYGSTPGTGSFTGVGSSVAGQVVAQQEAPVCRWDGRDHDTRTITMIFNRLSGGAGATFEVAPTTVNRSYRPFFHVLFGSGIGQAVEVFGDVGRGCQITFAASFCYANVGMDAPPSGATAGSMVVGGRMGFFSAARQSPVTRTAYVDSLSAAVASNIQNIEIPDFATTVESIIGQNVPNFTFNIQNIFATTLGSIPTANTFARSNGVVLPNDAYQIRVTNGGGSADSVEIVFGLSL